MENVSALTFRGLDVVLGTLAEIGYNAEWQDIRASDMGAPHRRERLWIVAYARHLCRRDGIGRDVGIFSGEQIKTSKRDATFVETTRPDTTQKVVADTRLQRQTVDEKQTTGIEQCSQEISDTTKSGRQCGESGECGQYPQCGTGLSGWSDTGIGTNYWEFEPAVGRLVNGLSGRVVRLKGLGNSIVPQIAELLFNQIKEILNENRNR
jgi:DNA (cytosine-5)-methyltransferase 1